MGLQVQPQPPSSARRQSDTTPCFVTKGVGACSYDVKEGGAEANAGDPDRLKEGRREWREPLSTP